MVVDVIGLKINQTMMITGIFKKRYFYLLPTNSKTQFFFYINDKKGVIKN